MDDQMKTRLYFESIDVSKAVNMKSSRYHIQLGDTYMKMHRWYWVTWD